MNLLPRVFILLQNYQSKVWITRPERSLGSNQVVLGGLITSTTAVLCIFYTLFGSCWCFFVIYFAVICQSVGIHFQQNSAKGNGQLSRLPFCCRLRKEKRIRFWG